MNETDDLPLWQNENAHIVLKELTAKHLVPTDVLKKLVAIEKQHQHRERARGIYDDFDNAFEKMD